MSWTWRYENESGDAVDGQPVASQAFPTQADAETWLGETWRDLLESGIDRVVLLEEDHVVYGPMSLHPAE